jgi:hypothetical protein
MKRLFLLFTIMFGMTPIQTEPIHVIRAFEPKSSLFFGSIAPNLITEKLPPKPPEFRYRNVSVLVNNETFEEQISKAKNKKVNFTSDAVTLIFYEAFASTEPVLVSKEIVHTFLSLNNIGQDFTHLSVDQLHEKYKDNLLHMENPSLDTIKNVKDAFVFMEKGIVNKEPFPFNLKKRIPDVQQFKNAVKIANEILDAKTIFNNNSDKWNSYLSETGEFVSFVPAHTAGGNGFYYNTANQLHSLTLENLNAIALTQQTNPQESYGNRLVSTVKTFLQGDATSPIEHAMPLNINITGHGLPSSQKKPDGYMAGIERSSFKQLTELLKHTNTETFYYNTCFGGGTNAALTFDPKTSLPYSVISASTTDRPTTVRTGAGDIGHKKRAQALTSYFNTINSNTKESLYALAETQKLPTLTSVYSDYKVRLKGTNWFTLQEINTKLNVISNQRSLSATVNKTPLALTTKDEIVSLTTDTVLSPFTSTLDKPATILPMASNAAETYYLKGITIDGATTLSQGIKHLHDLFSEVDSSLLTKQTIYIEKVIIGGQEIKNVVIIPEAILFVQTKSGLLNKKNIHKYFARKNLSSLSKPSLLNEKGIQLINEVKDVALRKKATAEKQLPIWKSINKTITQNTAGMQLFNALHDELTRVKTLLIETQEGTEALERKEMTLDQQLTDVILLRETIETMSILSFSQKMQLRSLAQQRSTDLYIQVLQDDIRTATTEQKINALQKEVRTAFAPDQIKEKRATQELIDSQKVKISTNKVVNKPTAAKDITSDEESGYGSEADEAAPRARIKSDLEDDRLSFEQDLDKDVTDISTTIKRDIITDLTSIELPKEGIPAPEQIIDLEHKVVTSIDSGISSWIEPRSGLQTTTTDSSPLIVEQPRGLLNRAPVDPHSSFPAEIRGAREGILTEEQHAWETHQREAPVTEYGGVHIGEEVRSGEHSPRVEIHIK